MRLSRHIDFIISGTIRRRPFLMRPGGMLSAAMLAILLVPFGVFAGPPSDGLSEAGEVPSASERIGEGLKQLHFYQVEKGKICKNIFQGKDLQAGEPITIDGHLYGVVAYCQEGTTIRIDGREMSKVRKERNGSALLRNYGIMRPKELTGPGGGVPEHGETFRAAETGQGEETALMGWYSFFPKIAGDAVSPKDRFQISIETEGKTTELAVQQEGYRPLRRISLKGGGAVTFRYIGAGLRDFTNSREFVERMHAIVGGIDYVQRATGMALVRNVNLIDMENKFNAVTYGEDGDIWFYSKTVQNESPDELETIAAHETLHKFVEAMRFTRNSRIRESFADLKGYDALSLERFRLVTTGTVPAEVPGEGGNADLFFRFINEKNFLSEKKGGHANSNLDEFSVSFIHSLIFVDRLALNLQRPVASADDQLGPQDLSIEDKRALLDRYIENIRLFLWALSQEPDRFPSSKTLFIQALSTASGFRGARPH